MISIFWTGFKTTTCYQDYQESFKAVRVIPDDYKLSGQFQNCIKSKKIRINHGRAKTSVFKPFPYYEILSGKCKKIQQDRRCKLKNLKKREEESFN